MAVPARIWQFIILEWRLGGSKVASKKPAIAGF
jgi:hypothetical protein